MGFNAFELATCHSKSGRFLVRDPIVFCSVSFVTQQHLGPEQTLRAKDSLSRREQHEDSLIRPHPVITSLRFINTQKVVWRR